MSIGKTRCMTIRYVRELSARIGGTVDNTTELAEIPERSREDGMLMAVGTRLYIFDVTAVSGDVAPSEGLGYWTEASYVSDPAVAPAAGQTLRADASARPVWESDPTAQAMHAPHGWVDRTESTVTVTPGTRTLQIAPVGASAAYWQAGYAKSLTASQSVVWADVEGIHFFYLDTSGTLQTTQTVATWEAAILGTGGVTVWALYWDAANNAVLRSLEERHGSSLDGQTHLHLHRGIGTRRYSGGTLSGFTLGGDGSLAAHAQFAADAVTIADEDMVFAFTDGTPQDLSAVLQAPVFYLSGAGTIWRSKAADGFAVVQAGSVTGTSGTRLQYNLLTGSTWSLAEVGVNNFVLAHLFASTDAAEPIMAVLGQAEYTTANLARIGAQGELYRVKGLLTLMSTEYTPLGTVIFQTGNYSNAPKARVVATDEGLTYVDFREGPR